MLRVLWLGNLCLGNGFPYALEAARLLTQSRVQFTFAGPCDLRLSSLRFPSNASYLGAVTRSEAAQLYRENDIFIFPTLSDGFGLTQIEAMAHGLPVIATRCCGDVVEDGKSGFLVESRDSSGLADSILRFVDERDLLPRMSSNALARSKDFEPGAIWPYYAEILAGGHPRAC